MGLGPPAHGGSRHHPRWAKAHPTRGAPFGLLLVGLALALALPAHAEKPATIVVGSKNFEESRLLAEMFAQLIEETTELAVERRLNLAGTQVCFAALESGAIDLYPEYTGTGLASILGVETGGGAGAPAGEGKADAAPAPPAPPVGAAATLARVRREFLARWNLVWLGPLGFENAYELAVPRSLAEGLGIATISDLVPRAGSLTGGFGYEFAERGDGLPGLERAYGLAFGSVRRLQQALKYQAVATGDVDVLDVYSTDGRLVSYDLVVLEDDRGFFPPYEAAPLVRGETLARHPEIAGALALLAGALDEAAMRRLNYRLQEEAADPAAVARDALVELGLLGSSAGEIAAPSGRDGSFLRYLWERRRELAGYTAQHLALSAAGLGLGILVAVPLGLGLERRRRWAEPIIRAVGITQTIPSLALLAFAVPFLGVGRLPAIVALWVYAIFPILRNTYTGVRDADPRAAEAATALGMTPAQVLAQVRLPLAAPVILAGIRTAAVLTVGTATLAAFIGAGGLGEPIVTGLQLADPRRILSGAIPAALLAVAVDLALAAVERRVAPRGLA